MVVSTSGTGMLVCALSVLHHRVRSPNLRYYLQHTILAFETQPSPISTTAFNRTGSIFAYAVSYDWSKGHIGRTQFAQNKIMLHYCKEEEVRKRVLKKWVTFTFLSRTHVRSQVRVTLFSWVLSLCKGLTVFQKKKSLYLFRHRCSIWSCLE